MAKEFTCWQIAQRIYPDEAKGASKTKRRALVRRVRRRLQRLGIVRQDSTGGRVFTTENDLRSLMTHVWADSNEQEAG
jgi:inactivated superfamily I helicase